MSHIVLQGTTKNNKLDAYAYVRVHTHTFLARVCLYTKCIDFVLEICVVTVGSFGGLSVITSSSSHSKVQTTI